MPKLHPEFEAGYREGHEAGYFLGRGAVAAAKRDLAVKVVVAVDAERLPLNVDHEDYDYHYAFNRGVDAVSHTLLHLFTSEGIQLDAITQKGVDGADIS